jgi:TRAP-type C4-dicarboxylate transport system substrate-binding protein
MIHERLPRLAALGACLSLLAVCLAAPVRAADSIGLTYANFPPKQTFPCVQMERWADEVEKRTDGKVSVKTFPGGTLLGGKAMYQGVIQGQADIGCMSMAYYPGVFPVVSVLEVPFGFTSATTAGMVLLDIYEKYEPAAFDKVKVLTMFTSAPSNLMSKVPVKTLEDLQGLEVRGAGGASRVLELLGATPVSMTMPETPEALQKGIVKGILTSLEVLMDFNFAELCRHETILNAQVYPFAVIMNMDAWNGLPDDVKQVFEDLKREQCLWTGEYMDDHVQESLKWSKEKYGIEVYELSAEDKAEVRSRLSGMLDEWKKGSAEKGVPVDEVVSDVKSLKKKYEAEYGG